MKALLGVFGALGSFFIFLNTFGGIISGIWLAVLGEWWAIGLGIVSIMLSSMLLGIALLPAIPLGAGAALFGERSVLGLIVFGLLSNLYTVAVMTAWCVGVLVIFISRAGDASFVPLLIWSYGVATGPWSYMAQKDVQAGGGEASVAAAFFAQVGYLAMVLVGVLFGGTIPRFVLVFGLVMIVDVLIQLSIAISLRNEIVTAD